jgi:hypothetical protein
MSKRGADGDRGMATSSRRWTLEILARCDITPDIS